MFENLIFFVRSQHTKSSNPAKMRRTTLETRVSTPASAPTHPDPSLRFFLSDGWTDVFFRPRLKVKMGDLLLHAHPGHTGM
jgi:hypothetical protein